jgi:hypothetical protein
LGASPSGDRYAQAIPDYVRDSASVFEFDKKVRMYGRDGLLFAEGDPAFYVYKLVGGVVICFRSWWAGRAQLRPAHSARASFFGG